MGAGRRVRLSARRPGVARATRAAVSLFPGQVIREIIAAVCTRSRYAEDRLAAGAFAQYVILGAGLDSFAWRRPDLLRSLRVFEVDHPASQAWKLERVRDLALPLSDSQVFVPVDFEAEPLRDALRTAGFDWGQPALFSWTGVAESVNLSEALVAGVY
jgi:methyltransferase (TIGR00027 family)